MGWNDRLPEDPYTPPSSYYRDREDYEAWLEYLDTRLDEEQAGLTSQNLDPAALAGSQKEKEQPRRQSLLARLWARISGQKVSENDRQESRGANREENANIPF
jgi:hypothetical protein